MSDGFFDGFGPENPGPMGLWGGYQTTRPRAEWRGGSATWVGRDGLPMGRGTLALEDLVRIAERVDELGANAVFAMVGDVPSAQPPSYQALFDEMGKSHFVRMSLGWRIGIVVSKQEITLVVDGDRKRSVVDRSRWSSRLARSLEDQRVRVAPRMRAWQDLPEHIKLSEVGRLRVLKMFDFSSWDLSE